MLRSLTDFGCKIFTCTVRRSYQTSPALCILADKNKNFANNAVEEKNELPDEVNLNQSQLEGLTEGGITIPTKETFSMVVDGVRFDELPICYIKTSRNNTLMLVTNHTGQEKLVSASCGTEGFRNAKKSSNVAAQATGLAIGQRALKKGVDNVRVVLKGLGVGRLASIKGLQMAGMNVVSITDNTTYAFSQYKPRKQKRK